MSATCGVASATPTVIYSNIVGDATSNIPGGGTWDTDFSFFTLNISTSGQFWLLNFQDDNTDPEVLVAGSGTVGNTVLREDVDGFNGEVVQGIDSSGRINNAGQWVVGADYDSSGAADDVILGGNLSGLTTEYAREGGAIPESYGFGPGNTWDTLDTTAIDQSGRAFWISDGVDGPAFTSANNEFIATSNNEVIAQKGVDVPGNQALTNAPFDDFDLDDLHVSDDGSQWLVRGDIGTGVNDDALFVNGDIVIREDFTLSEVGITGADALTDPVDGLTGGIEQQFMAGNGDWYAHGTTIDSSGEPTSWAVRNGALIAATGTETFVGSGEVWNDALDSGTRDFDVIAGNSLGDYILGGGVENGDQVLVLNGLEEVLRTGDGVDLDGNGLLDDVLFFSSFEFQETRLGDDLTVYALVNFQDANGIEVGSGFISFVVPSPGAFGLIGLASMAGVV
ncbi:MAG: hypothetical protein AAGH64_06655, partial [Planctomycetota bacterium]